MTRLPAFAATILLAATATTLWALSNRQEGFPHEKHRGLFPLCAGCHSGIESGDQTDAYPAPGSCVTCHDGVVEDRVEWDGPGRSPTNLAYSHPVHAERVLDSGGESACATCHAAQGDTTRMAVQVATAEGCLTCHAHEAPTHLASERDCAVCHVTLRDAEGLTAERIASFPTPQSHDAPDFQTAHGALATAETTGCAFCHAQESCTRCHMNDGALEAIRQLDPDPRVALLMQGTSPEYVEPASHEVTDWSLLHGRDALSSPDGCANCHSQPSCRGCHIGSGPAAVTSLPQLEEGDPRGVQISSAAVAVHPDGFTTEHGAVAAAMEDTCAGCHGSDSCVDCHNGPGGGFHPSNFLQMHAPEAYGNQSDCASCHSPEVFCRGCHTDTGLGSRGSIRGAFHSAQPLWLLGHGNAARQGLESCVTCHRQVDCMRCHSAVGSWRINPHGPDFEAERLQKQNISTCALCHRVGP